MASSKEGTMDDKKNKVEVIAEVIEEIVELEYRLANLKAELACLCASTEEV